MINDKIKRNKKLQELLEITNISDEDVEKLDFRGKQQYYKAKSQLCKIFFKSSDKNGKGKTYIKPKEVKKDE